MKLLLILSLICVGVVVVQAKLKVKFHWKQLTFAWPSDAAEKAAITSGEYVPENNLPLGLERWNNKLFITVPRWKAGVASSLNYVDLSSTDKSPKLIPYPSWEATKLPTEKCEGGCELRDNSTIVSTFRINIDACGRLWVMDTGVADVLGNATQVTGGAIVVFDLKTDKLIRRFTIPKNQVKPNTFFPNIIVDSDRSDCSNSYAYVPDLGEYGVVVYSFRDDHSYRVSHNFFHFDPLRGNFNVGGVNFQLTDGVFGMAVGPKRPNGSKDIYFHALASTKEFKVNNRILQNETHVTSGNAYNDFKFVGDRGMKGQSTAEGYDKKTGVIFYTQVNKNAVACWNVKRPYTPKSQGLVDLDSRTLEFPNDLKVDALGTVWVLSDRQPTFIYKKLDPTAVNYRVLMGNTRELIKGTKCEMKRFVC